MTTYIQTQTSISEEPLCGDAAIYLPNVIARPRKVGRGNPLFWDCINAIKVALRNNGCEVRLLRRLMPSR